MPQTDDIFFSARMPLTLYSLTPSKDPPQSC